jgi:sugar lactone lactonase YvrE
MLREHADAIAHAKFMEKCDWRGWFWFGSMNNITRRPEGALLSRDLCANLITLLSGTRIPSSLVWRPDGQTMYFAGSILRPIYAYASDPVTGERKIFLKTVPLAIADGAAVDAEGLLWSAEYNCRRIIRCTPDGYVDQITDLTVQRPTNCAFGRPNFDALYVTTTTQPLTRTEIGAAAARRCAAGTRRRRARANGSSIQLNSKCWDQDMS